jgi:hypothetical protein
MILLILKAIQKGKRKTKIKIVGGNQNLRNIPKMFMKSHLFAVLVILKLE